jgi:hypothetical protein
MSLYVESLGVENFFCPFVAHHISTEIAFLRGFFIHGPEMLVRGRPSQIAWGFLHHCFLRVEKPDPLCSVDICLLWN